MSRPNSPRRRKHPALTRPGSHQPRFGVTVLEDRSVPAVLSALPATGATLLNPASFSPVTGDAAQATLDGKLYFAATDALHGTEPWVSDGTAAGTHMLKDLNPGPLSSGPASFQVVGDQLVFVADVGNGQQLWGSDGTDAGTQALTTIESGNTWGFTALNGKLYFGTDDGGLWTTDGTAAGTAEVKDFSGAHHDGFVDWLAANGSTLDFTTWDSAGGYQLWKSDGTAANTVQVASIDAGATLPDSSVRPENLTTVGNELFFTASDGTHGRELWASDGTQAGTQMVTDINPGSADAVSSNTLDVNVPLTQLNGKVYFAADDGTHGQELWSSDGTTAGTQMVADINPGSGDAVTDPTGITVFNGKLSFTANDGTHGQELWTNDGTAAGTQMVTDINPGPGGSAPGGFGNDKPVVFNNALVFGATDGTHGRQLWVSDGTAAGTHMLQATPPLQIGDSPHDQTVLNGELYFVADDGAHAQALWQTDGTTAGTHPFADVHLSGTVSGPEQLTSVGSSLLLLANTGVLGQQLQLLDTTALSVTQTALTTTAAAAPRGQAVTLTATVSVNAPIVGTPTGSVTFLNGNTVLGTANLDATGKATLSTSTLSLGAHSITAVYGGDTASAGGNSAVLHQTITGALTQTTLSGSAAAVSKGDPVTFTSWVGTKLPGLGTPTGTVTFYDGATALGTVALDGSGKATLKTYTLTPGSHAVTAVYNGAAAFQGSTALAVGVTVNIPTFTSLFVSKTTAVTGQSVKLTASVTPAHPGPFALTGTVTFFDNGKALGHGTLANGVATFTVSGMKPGTHHFTAAYGGNSHFQASPASAVQVVKVSADAVTVGLKSSAASAVFGQPVTFTATITPKAPGAGVPTGKVRFWVNGVALGTATLVNGVAKFTTSALPPGTTTVKATYGGDAGFSSAAASIAQSVAGSNASVAIQTSVTQAKTGQEVVFKATVSAKAPGTGTPTGSVLFMDGQTVLGLVKLNAGGVATLKTKTLALGKHLVTAVYLGDLHFGKAISPAALETIKLDA
jgi:ELWxxDGT repeat protein